MKCFKEFMEHAGASKKELDDYLHRLKKQKKEIIENLEKKWIYFILEKKVQAQYFGMKRLGAISKIS